MLLKYLLIYSLYRETPIFPLPCARLEPSRPILNWDTSFLQVLGVDILKAVLKINTDEGLGGE
jgi:hypothetical protein